MFYYETSMLILHAIYVSICSGGIAKEGKDIDNVTATLLFDVLSCHKPSFHKPPFLESHNTAALPEVYQGF